VTSEFAINDLETPPPVTSKFAINRRQNPRSKPHMAKSDDSAKMPSHVDERLSMFDRFATYTSERVSKAWFFGVCAVLVLIWVPTFWLWPSIDGWALVINTFTSTITFLLVALLQNTETRAENATQRKLNALAEALADLMDTLGAENPDLRRSRDELATAVGVERRESTK
jgi:low affinity Fe/Cu permease